MTNITPAVQALLEKQAKIFADRLEELLRMRMETVFTRLLAEQGDQFAGGMEALMRRSLHSVLNSDLAPSKTRAMGYTPSALQRGADLLAELEKAKRNL